MERCRITITQCDANSSSSPPSFRGARPLLVPASVIVALVQVQASGTEGTNPTRQGVNDLQHQQWYPSQIFCQDVNNAEQPRQRGADRQECATARCSLSRILTAHCPNKGRLCGLTSLFAFVPLGWLVPQQSRARQRSRICMVVTGAASNSVPLRISTCHTCVQVPHMDKRKIDLRLE